MKAILFIIVTVTLIVNVSTLSASTDSPTRDTIMAVLNDMVDCWVNNDVELFKKVLHDDVMFAAPGARFDKIAVVKAFEDYQADYKNTKMYVHKIIIEDSSFSVEYQFASTNRETDKRQCESTLVTGEYKDGKIILWKEYWDDRVGEMQERGELPLDEGAVPFPWPEKQ